MDTFTIRDLRERTGDFVRDAEAGKSSVPTKPGHPLGVLVPFDETLVRQGVPVALAIKLFAEETMTLRQAAKFAKLPLADFMQRCGAAGVSVVRCAYPPYIFPRTPAGDLAVVWGVARLCLLCNKLYESDTCGMRFLQYKISALTLSHVFYCKRQNIWR